MSDETTDLEAQIAALEAEAALLEQAARDVELTPAEKRMQAARERAQAAREAAAAAETARRGLDMAARVAAVKKRLEPGALVAGVDLVSLFPLGSAPPAERLPNGGVIVVRNPPPAAIDDLNREVEAKEKPVSSLLGALLIECTEDPPKGPGAEAVKLGSFVTTYPDAAMQAAQKARELGGAKARADKRGRT